MFFSLSSVSPARRFCASLKPFTNASNTGRVLSQLLFWGRLRLRLPRFRGPLAHSARARRHGLRVTARRVAPLTPARSAPHGMYRANRPGQEVTMAKRLEFSNMHAPLHAVRVIQAEGARRGIIAIVVAGIS